MTLENLGAKMFRKTENRLSAWDYSVVGVFLLGSAFFGVYFGILRPKRNDSQAGYFLGDRRLGLTPTAVSLMATFFSALTLVCNFLSSNARAEHRSSHSISFHEYRLEFLAKYTLSQEFYTCSKRLASAVES